MLSNRIKIDDAGISVGLMRVWQQRAAGRSLYQSGPSSIFRLYGLPFIFNLPNCGGSAASSCAEKENQE